MREGALGKLVCANQLVCKVVCAISTLVMLEASTSAATSCLSQQAMLAADVTNNAVLNNALEIVHLVLGQNEGCSLIMQNAADSQAH